MLSQIASRTRDYVESQVAKVMIVAFVLALIIRELWDDKQGPWPR